jgi:uncharacterized protein (DUF1330 family)
MPTSEPALGKRAGYLFVNGSFWDGDKRDRYSARLPPIYRQYRGSYIAFRGTIDVVEGLWAPRGSLLAQFESLEAVDRFWWSPEYRAAAELRLGGGAFTVLGLESRHPAVRPPKGAALMIVLAKVRDEARLDRINDAILALAPEAKLLVSAAANSLRPLEGAFFDTAIQISQWPSLDRLKALLADPAPVKLASERRLLGDVVVLARPTLDEPPF